MSLLSAIASVFVTPSRYLSTFQLYTTIEETHDDELEVTDHPVQQGASITDHSFKRQASLRMTIGWSDASLEGLLFGKGYAKAAYAQMLALQATRVPFSVSTGKRLYNNMLITSLSTQTDASTENSLILRVSMREVILVAVTTTALQAETQADPSATAATVNAGTQTAKASNVSLLARVKSLL